MIAPRGAKRGARCFDATEFLEPPVLIYIPSFAQRHGGDGHTAEHFVFWLYPTSLSQFDASQRQSPMFVHFHGSPFPRQVCRT
jgi:hypothetical protein